MCLTQAGAEVFTLLFILTLLPHAPLSSYPNVVHHFQGAVQTCLCSASYVGCERDTARVCCCAPAARQLIDITCPPGARTAASRGGGARRTDGRTLDSFIDPPLGILCSAGGGGVSSTTRPICRPNKSMSHCVVSYPSLRRCCGGGVCLLLCVGLTGYKFEFVVQPRCATSIRHCMFQSSYSSP